MSSKLIDITLVCGFLEAGKTTYINQMISNNPWDGNVLLLQCEEGETEYENLPSNYAIFCIEYSEDFNRADLADVEERFQPDHIIMEINGTWQLQTVQMGMPSNWRLKEMITIIDASTFLVYSKNMNSLMSEKIRFAHQVIFNRVNEKLAAMLRSRNLRLVNNTKNMLLQYEDHTEPYDDGTLRPKTFLQQEFAVADDNYGFWFADFTSEPSFYLNKTITLQGSFVKPKELADDQFVIGRSAMVCCASDMVFLGMLCHGFTTIEPNSWIRVQGIIQENKVNPKLAPYIIEVISVQKEPEIENPIVY